MLSICIPIFNCRVYKLVEELTEQCISAQVVFELICIDDASDIEFQNANGPIQTIPHVTYIILEKNIGRSAIRNLFLQHASQPYLLFLDCDSMIPDNHFISNYLTEIKPGIGVLCGGRTYPEKPTDKQFMLRWNYGTKRECPSANNRAKKTYHSFLSNNFIIKRSIFEKIQFDERIKGYGHEDTLFGYSLKKSAIPLSHIHNPTIHDYSENAREFVLKTRQSVQNLWYISSNICPGEDFAEMVKLLKWFKILEKWKIHMVMALLYKCTGGLLQRLFTVGMLNGLFWFDMYKLMLICYYSENCKNRHI
jgi:glycosyltransferase involved in cell wall biosynthesis